MIKIDFKYPTIKYNIISGAPAVTQRDWCHLESTGMQVRSLAWHSGLRIWHCHSCDLGQDCGLGLTPGLGASYAMDGQKWKKNRQTKNIFFSFLRPPLWHMEIPRLRVESELQLPAYTTAGPDLSSICDLDHSSWQHWILNPLIKARDLNPHSHGY